MDIALQVHSHKCFIEGKDHFPGFVGYAPPITAQDVFGLLCCKGTLLTHVQLVGKPDPQVPFYRAVSYTVSPQLVLLHGVISSWMQDLAFPFNELHEVSVTLFLHPVQVPLKSSSEV